jgi:hypothetical protein
LQLTPDQIPDARPITCTSKNVSLGFTVVNRHPYRRSGPSPAPVTVKTPAAPYTTAIPNAEALAQNFVTEDELSRLQEDGERADMKRER